MSDRLQEERQRYVLAIDSALSGCGAALFDLQAGQGISERLDTPRGQAEQLVPLIQRVMAQAGVSFSDVGLVVTTVGPGSFTGLRIGLATAQGLALAIGCPLQGVLSSDVLVAGLAARIPHKSGPVWVAIDTRRGDLFVCHYASPSTVPCDPAALRVVSPSDFVREVRGGLVIGDGRALLPPGIFEDGGGADIDPLVLARLGAILFADFSYDLRGVARPVYLRAAEISVSKKPSRRSE